MTLGAAPSAGAPSAADGAAAAATGEGEGLPG